MARFEICGVRTVEREVDGEPPFVWRARDSQALQPLDDLDEQGADRQVAAVGSELPGCSHDAVRVAAAHQEKRVLHAEVRVLAEPEDDEHLPRVVMAVEVVAVVEVAIAGADVADGLGDLMVREVVER